MLPSTRRAILVVCDGLGNEWVTPDLTPRLQSLAERHRVAGAHRGVFPSVTRVSAACVATGCRPERHGLTGNRMALIADGRLTVHDVGHAGFVHTLRALTGATLTAPTLAERLAPYGGQVAYSNVSAGAARFLDPDHHGTVLHRSGSFGPGGRPLSGSAHLDVSHDLAGDLAMTRRFCDEVVARGTCALGILWLANPDLALHHNALGSPEHVRALAEVDEMVGMVADAVQACPSRRDTLLLVGSDHGHETIGASVHVGGWLSRHGLGRALEAGEIAIAGQGNAALVHALGAARDAFGALVPELRRQAWVRAVHVGGALRAHGLDAMGTLVAALDTGWCAAANRYGVIGQRWMVADGEAKPRIGCGQHGGLGAREMAPFLTLAHPSLPPATIEQGSSLIDIAPTILDYLSLDARGTQGRSLLGAAGVRHRARGGTDIVASSAARILSTAATSLSGAPPRP